MACKMKTFETNVTNITFYIFSFEHSNLEIIANVIYSLYYPSFCRSAFPNHHNCFNIFFNTNTKK